MLWLLQLFIGGYLAYYCISPRLRGFTNRLIVRLFRIAKPSANPSYPKVKFRYVLGDKAEPEEPGEPLETEPIILGTKHGILVSEDKFEEMMRNNPDLQGVNKVKELVK